YNRNYFSVLGAIDRIKAFAQVQKKSWHRGQRSVLRSYRLVMAHPLSQCTTATELRGCLVAYCPNESGRPKRQWKRVD
ncbi:MAG: hypothetical protein PVJ68_03600, partial [Candidatus Thiodiazotropha sp.]